MIYLADGFFQQILVQLDILACLLNANISALFERTAATDIRGRAHGRVRQIREDGALKVQRNSAWDCDGMARGTRTPAAFAPVQVHTLNLVGDDIHKA